MEVEVWNQKEKKVRGGGKSNNRGSHENENACVGFGKARQRMEEEQTAKKQRALFVSKAHSPRRKGAVRGEGRGR